MRVDLERFRPYLPDFIERRVTQRARSYKDFISLLEEENAISVVATPVIKLDQNPFSSLTVVGHIGNFEYGGFFTSRSLSGQKIVFEERYGERFGSTSGMGDARERGLAALRTIATIDRRLDTIRECLPHIVVDIAGPGGPMDEKTLRKARAQASEMGVTPWETADKSQK